ncbi:NAD(+)/NADH kinase [Veillonella magna]|uniref:NAD(+)/NADH kinase n=1 Tax=Veillonella magna TaxID=464322 RepID=UPI00259ABCE8|nr:NAD(+)/NADH kinase [Veillonella magna]
MRVGFFPNMGKENIRDVMKRTAQVCRKNGMDVVLPADLRHYDVPNLLDVPDELVMPRPEVFKHLDMAFSFGGDGTIIHLARQIHTYDVPVCGINLGELGFLNQIELDNLDDRIERIAKGDIRIENRVHLAAEIHGADGTVKKLTPIINEVVVTRSEPGKMARVNLAINGGHTQMYPADGIIVACSTGSTGYNLSAGGPIMAPDNHSIIVTPIAPHLLQGVSLVLKESAKIDLTMPKRQASLHICIDGTFDYDFTNEESLHIEASPMYCRYVRFHDQKFFATLFRKLSARRNELL